jgi:hypothetical protein
MRTIGVLVAAALLLLLVPVPAPAYVYGYCNGSYTTSASCNFPVVGVGYYLFGTSSSGDVTVSIKDPLGRELAFCSGEFFCAASFAPVGTGSEVPLPTPGLGPLVCQVQGAGSGFYYCHSQVA